MRIGINLLSLLLFLSVQSNVFGSDKVLEPGIRIIELSGNNQYVRAEKEPAKPLLIQVVKENQPADSVEILVTMIRSAGKGLAEPIAPNRLYTNSEGIARLNLPVMPEAGEYEFLVSCPNIPNAEPLLITLNVRKKNWVFLLITGLLGGLGLFLLGMSMMSEGMQNSAGNHMRTMLSKLTHNRIVALGLGALVTMIIQSSSATNVMLVSFVNSRLMRFKQTIGIMLGAAIGTTITAQIIAFKLTDYALLFVVLGLLVNYLPLTRTGKELGKAILGFGILFYGMHIMSESMYPLRTYDPFLQAIVNLQNPALGILVGALFTALIQSSSAFIGILIILSMQGLLSIGAAIPLLIGANVGTSITAILASLNASRESKQVALAHTIFKVIGAIIALIFISAFTQLIINTAAGSMQETANGELIAQPRQIANAHTVYNIILCSLFIPFTTAFARFITWIFPSREEPEVPFRLKYIDLSLLKTPTAAMDTARMELVRMMKKVYFMLEKIIHPFLERDTTVLPEIDKAEKEIDFLRDNISDFLLKITQNTQATDITEEAFILMDAVREFEQIADIISQQFREKAESWCASEFDFSEVGKQELRDYHDHTLSILVNALKVYENSDLDAARKLKSHYKKYRKEFFEMEQRHYDRLRDNIENSHDSSKTHLEIITLLKVISSHATNTSRILIYKNSSKKRSK